MISERRKHASEDLQAQILFVAQPIDTSLNHADRVVETLDEPERDFVLWLAVHGDTVPMTIDHVGELLVRLQALPLQCRPPGVEEAPRPTFALVAPQLAEGFLQGGGDVQPLVDS